MVKEIRAKFSKGVIEPLEKVDLTDGEEFIISIKALPTPEHRRRALETAAGAWEGTHDPKALKRHIYADRLIDTRREPSL